MTVLKPNEYDISYFDGKHTSLTHNAGYTEYKRWNRRSPSDFPADQGEFFKDIAKVCVDKYSLQGKKILVVGCAKGYIVEDLRSLGVDAYGIDVSSYAIGEASPEVQPYLTVADAKTHLKTYSANEFDVIFSRWFLCCIGDVDMPGLVKDMNAKSSQQVHIIMKFPNPSFYHVKTAEEWRDTYKWEKGTVFVKNNMGTSFITK